MKVADSANLDTLLDFFNNIFNTLKTKNHVTYDVIMYCSFRAVQFITKMMSKILYRNVKRHRKCNDYIYKKASARIIVDGETN